jgi:hypothetical protein
MNFATVKETIVVTKPIISFDFSPSQALVLSKNLQEVKLYLTRLANDVWQCGGCGVWGADHESGSGFGYNCTRREPPQELSVSMHYKSGSFSRYIAVHSDTFDDVVLEFGEEKETRANAKMMLDAWPVFVDHVTERVKLYESTPDWMTLRFDRDRLNKRDRKTLEEMIVRYPATMCLTKD